jgi:hypothetical protein
MVRSSTDARRVWVRGAFAGAAGGIFLTLMMILMSAARGKDVWYGMKGAAAPFLGDRALEPGFDLLAVVLGLFDHLIISAVWGVLFALAFFGANRVATIVGGILWGFVVWLGMYYVVLPLVGLGWMQHDAPVGRAIMFHLLYSIAMTAAFFAYPRVFARSWRARSSRWISTA